MTNSTVFSYVMTAYMADHKLLFKNLYEGPGMVAQRVKLPPEMPALRKGSALNPKFYAPGSWHRPGPVLGVEPLGSEAAHGRSFSVSPSLYKQTNL